MASYPHPPPSPALLRHPPAILRHPPAILRHPPAIVRHRPPPPPRPPRPPPPVGPPGAGAAAAPAATSSPCRADSNNSIHFHCRRFRVAGAFRCKAIRHFPAIFNQTSFKVNSLTPSPHRPVAAGFHFRLGAGDASATAATARPVDFFPRLCRFSFTLFSQDQILKKIAKNQSGIWPSADIFFRIFMTIFRGFRTRSKMADSPIGASNLIFFQQLNFQPKNLKKFSKINQ